MLIFEFKEFNFKVWKGLSRPILPNLSSRLYISPDVYEEHDSIDFTDTGLACDSFPDKLTEWLADPIRQEFIEAYLIKHKLPLSVLVLFAHGFQEGNTWRFIDGKSTHKIGDWVKLMDGKYGLIVLASCNEARSTIPTKQSLILQPSSIIGHTDKYGENALYGTWNLYTPGGQEVDDYALEYELKIMLD